MPRSIFRVIALAAACSAVAMPAVSGEVPERLLGRWGLNVANCTDVPASGVVEVSRSTLNYPKATGVLSTVISQTPDRIVGYFTFEGEGRTWHRRIILAIYDDGATLITREYGPGALPGVERYARCP